MLRDIVICLAFTFLGFGVGYAVADRDPPTRQDRAEQLVSDLEEEMPEVSATIFEETGKGPVIHIKSSAIEDPNAMPLARVEIGYEGQYLPSFWNESEGFYAFHNDQPMTADEIIETLSGPAEQ